MHFIIFSFSTNIFHFNCQIDREKKGSKKKLWFDYNSECHFKSNCWITSVYHLTCSSSWSFELMLSPEGVKSSISVASGRFECNFKVAHSWNDPRATRANQHPQVNAHHKVCRETTPLGRRPNAPNYRTMKRLWSAKKCSNVDWML